MFLVKTYLGKSKIHGLGVFAGEFIPKGKRVWVFVEGFDRSWTPKEFKKLPKQAQDFIRHYGYQSEGEIMLTADHDCYANHSNDANTVFRKSGYIVARRNIKKGEEITDDYRAFDPVFCAGFLKTKKPGKRRK